MLCSIISIRGMKLEIWGCIIGKYRVTAACSSCGDKVLLGLLGDDVTLSPDDVTPLSGELRLRLVGGAAISVSAASLSS